MFILDTLLIGGLRFVFDKIAAAVDTELNDDTRAARAAARRADAPRARRDRARRSSPRSRPTSSTACARSASASRERPRFPPGEYKITGIDATFEGDEHK